MGLLLRSRPATDPEKRVRFLARRLRRGKGLALDLPALFYRCEREAVTWFYRLTFSRPSSAPFVSGDGFRALTRWRFGKPDPATFPVDRLPPNALVFCNAWHLDRFLVEVAPRIPVPFRIVSHNGDPNLTDTRMAQVPPQVRRIYSQNAVTTDPRVVALPIGLEDARLHNNGIRRDFVQLRKGPHPTRNRILYGFSVWTNAAAREPARLALSRVPTADPLRWTHSRAYRRLAAQYRFVASPPGNGEDCHRTWEALYLRSVPIVIRSPMTQQFRALGLPLWLVDSYDELVDLTEADLETIYQDFQSGFDHPALWMDYWVARLAQDEVSP